MIIILEGPDNSGKTTLAKKLSLDTGFEVCHPGGPPKNINDALACCWQQSFAFIHSDHISFIYDRVTCISQRIYCGKSEYHDVFDRLRRRITENNVLVVFCWPSVDRMRNFDDHITQAHETDEVVEHAKRNVDRIIAEYAIVKSEMLAEDSAKVFEYNFEADTYGSQYHKLLNIIREMV